MFTSRVCLILTDLCRVWHYRITSSFDVLLLNRHPECFRYVKNREAYLGWRHRYPSRHECTEITWQIFVTLTTAHVHWIQCAPEKESWLLWSLASVEVLAQLSEPDVTEFCISDLFVKRLDLQHRASILLLLLGEFVKSISIISSNFEQLLSKRSHWGAVASGKS